MLNETKKIHMQKGLNKGKLIEFILMIFYGGAVKNNLESISNIAFSNQKMKNKGILIDLVKSDKTEKEIKTRR